MQIKFKIISLACTLISFALQAQIQQPVKWVFTMEQVNQKEAVIKMTAILDHGWHIYSQHMEDGGPLPTNFSFKRSGEYELVGSVKEESEVIEKFDNTFLMDVKWFDNQAIFTQRVKLKAPAATIHGTVEFMACTDDTCLLPEEVDFKVLVVRGDQDNKKENN